MHLAAPSWTHARGGRGYTLSSSAPWGRSPSWRKPFPGVPRVPDTLTLHRSEVRGPQAARQACRCAHRLCPGCRDNAEHFCLPASPFFLFSDSDRWAKGVALGSELRFPSQGRKTNISILGLSAAVVSAGVSGARLSGGPAPRTQDAPAPAHPPEDAGHPHPCPPALRTQGTPAPAHLPWEVSQMRLGWGMPHPSIQLPS